DAELVAEAFECWGEDAVRRLRGVFALVIADHARYRLLCARDPIGMHPLFYADVGRTLLLSPSIETLLGHPDVSTELNRPRLVDHLLKRWLAPEETYFTHIRRVPPGHVMQIRRQARHVYRYWDPVPSNGGVEWVPDDEAQDRFESLLAQAIARCLA